MTISEAELILNQDGSVYHLNLLPGDIAETVLIVGDPGRVPEVSRYFDSIELKKHKRELVTHTGYLGKQRLTVLSTGMSTDNIDIVFNELDALVNIDLEKREIKPTLKKLNIIRIGTAGGLQPQTPAGSFVVSTSAIGMDGLANFYAQPHISPEESGLASAFAQYFHDEPAVQNCYAAKGDKTLINLLASHHPDCLTGITATCGGFYAPQGRVLRLKPQIADFIPRLQKFNYQGQVVTNLEMETSGIYALGGLLGHRCCSISAIVANRHTGEYCHNAAATVDKLIQHVLARIENIKTLEKSEISDII